MTPPFSYGFPMVILWFLQIDKETLPSAVWLSWWHTDAFGWIPLSAETSGDWHWNVGKVNKQLWGHRELPEKATHVTNPIITYHSSSPKVLFLLAETWNDHPPMMGWLCWLLGFPHWYISAKYQLSFFVYMPTRTPHSCSLTPFEI